jgi:hypothetical protein
MKKTTCWTRTLTAGILLGRYEGKKSPGSAGEEDKTVSSFAGCPLSGGATVSWRTENALGGRYARAAESPFHSGPARRVGVAINRVCPAEGAPSSRAFNRMPANGARTDIIVLKGRRI